MATKSWVGATIGGAWTTAANWSPAAAPIASDNLVLSAAWAAGTPTITTPAGAINFTDITASSPTTSGFQLIVGDTTIATTWTPPANAFISVALGSYFLTFVPAILGSNPVSKKGAGLLDFNNNTASETWTGKLTIEAGTVTFGSTNAIGTSSTIEMLAGSEMGSLNSTVSISNAVTIKGSVRLNNYANFVAARNLFTMSGPVTIDAANPTLNITRASGTANNVTISGAITDNGNGFTKDGVATLTLGGASANLTGTVTLSTGTLTTTNVNALQNATLDYNGGTFTPVASSNIGALAGTSSTATIALATSSINVGANNASTTYAGKFTSTAGTITKQGTGVWTLTGDNIGRITAGAWVISAGTLSAESNNALGANALTVTVSTGATLKVANNTSITRSSTTTLGANPTINVAAGSSLTQTGELSGGGGFTLDGAGSLTLQRANNNSLTAGTVTLGASSTTNLNTSQSPATALLGRLLGTGTSAVVNGTVKTSANTAQRGQMRYGTGGLTLGATAQLYIGGIA